MPVLLEESEWRARQEAHHARVDAWIEPHLQRARAAEKHPVHDFLFTYYSHRPAQLRRWHPGVGVGLSGAAPHREWTNYACVDGVVAVDLERVLSQRARAIEHLVGLLKATASRRPLFGCFGLHEWAMVYRADEVRHEAYPLRLPPKELAEVVEAEPLRCTHYDAFRFFTPPAAPLNLLQLTREEMPQHEQGGCLHTNMDLYKIAYKLTPLVPSELVGDCFALARDIRELDMRASPYDLADLGVSPVRIETEEGRQVYVAEQRGFAERAAVLRTRLLEALAPVDILRPWKSPT
ncbi:MAG: 3-methyladenine DNA glycosylase [Sporichthyaceae bacterium]